MPIIDLLDRNLYVTEEIRKARLEICNACPYKRSKLNSFLEYCLFCTCLINQKTKLKTEECPILKWKKV